MILKSLSNVLKAAPPELKFASRVSYGGQTGDYELTEEFLKANRSLAFGYRINSARTETMIFIEF